jgi:hypothetical protein
MNIGIGRAGRVALVLASLLALAGCGGAGGYGGGGGGGSAPTGTITMITVSPSTSTVAVNGTQQYTAVGKDSGGNTVNGATFTWTSSNPSVATVDNSGLATGKAAGTAMITASISYSGGIYGPGVTYTSTPVTLTVSASGMAVGNVAVGSSSQISGMNGGMMMMGGVIGRAVQGATVSLEDSTGQTVVAMTDGNAHYQLATSGLNGGFLLKAVDNQGHVLFSFADGAGNINVTPLTDLMVRMWYGAHGASADAAFADPAAHPVPQAAELSQLNKAITGLLSNALSRQGLDPAKFDLIATPFSVNGPGFGAVLDGITVSPTNGGMLLRDMLGGRETLITFDAAHDAVTLRTTAMSGQAAVIQASLVLH